MFITQIPSKILQFGKKAVIGIAALNPFSTATSDSSAPTENTKPLAHIAQMERADTIKSHFAPPNAFTQIQTQGAADFFGIATKIRTLITGVQTPNPELEESTQSFERTINANISPQILEGVQKIQYNDQALKDSCNELIDHREKDYIARIHTLNAQQNQLGEALDLSQYNEIFDDFFTESLTLLHNFNQVLFHRITEPDNFKASNLDIAQGFKQTRNITATLSTKILNDFLMLLNQLPGRPEKDVSLYIEQLKEDFQSPIKTLFQSSHFGILDRDIVEGFIAHYLEKSQKESLNDVDMTILKEFQDGIHGCLLMKPNLEGTEIASLDLRITQKIIKDLNSQIIELTTLEGDNDATIAKRIKLNEHIANIISYIASTGGVERTINGKVGNLLNDEIAVQLGISKQDLLAIVDSYRGGLDKDSNGIFKTEGFVGRTVSGNINGKRFPEEPLLNNFTVNSSNYSNIDGKNLIKHSSDFSQKYERLVLEASMVASYHALAEHTDGLSQEKREQFFKTPEYANFNKMQVPWLKDFYNQELERYRKMVANDKSPRGTVDLALSVCQLAERLASSDIGIYRSNDFFNRYMLEEIAEKALERVGRMTDVNKKAFSLMIYSRIFSNPIKDSGEAGLEAHERKWLSSHVDFLIKISTLKDKDGNPIYAPKDNNPYEMDKFEELKKYFSDPGTVGYNLDLILKYFTGSLVNKRIKSKETGSERYSDLSYRNLLLASALIYHYLKFIPEEAQDLESLKSKETIITLMLDPALRPTINLQKEQGHKILDNLLGVESNENGEAVEKAKYDRQGFIRSYALGIEDKVNNYITGEDTEKIDLKTLLNFYLRLEEIKTKNLEVEYQKYPKHRGQDPTSMDDKQLSLWSKVVKNHIKFHNGKNKELLPPLKTKLIKLLDEHTMEVLQFLHGIKDPQVKEELSTEVAKALFNKAADSAKELLAYQQNGITEIVDTNQEALSSLINTLANLARISNLQYRGHQSRFNMTDESTLGEDNPMVFSENLKLIDSVLKSNFLLVNESPTKQNSRLKTIALNLLRAFRVKPQIGTHLNWIDSDQIERYLDQQITSNSKYSYADAA